MLSSLISEKTVKKGAPFSHTLSPLSHSFRLYPCPSIVQSGGADKASNSVPSYLLSPLSNHLFLAITQTCAPPLPSLPAIFSSSIYIHQLPLLFNPVISALTKLLNASTSGSSSLFFVSLWVVALFSQLSTGY